MVQIYIEDQNALLLSDVHNLVECIRANGNIRQISMEIDSINDIVGNLVSETQNTGRGSMVTRLSKCRDHLVEAKHRGQDLADSGAQEQEWGIWTQTLPPIAFEVAQEAKELVDAIGELVASSRDADDFS
jgi:hypothetical protein